MKPIKQILVALFFVVCNLTVSAALNPPFIQAPVDGSDSLSPESVAMKCNANGGSYVLYQVDVSPQFNSPDLKQQLLGGQYFTVKNLRLNQTYYWRAKTYNYLKTDSSNWSDTYTFKTSPGKTIRIPKFNEYEQLTYTVLGLNHHVIGLEIKIDTTKSLNSPFANTSNMVPFDSTKYYFSYRSYFHSDTSVWSEIDSFETAFRQSITIRNYCTNGKIELRCLYYTGVYSTSPNKGVRFEFYEDASKTAMLKDTFIANNYGYSLFLDDCVNVFCVFSSYGTQDTVKAQFYTDPCAELGVNQLNARLYKDSILFNVASCADSVEIQFDKDTLFNTPALLKEVIPTNGKTYVSKFFQFKENPIKYVYRARFYTGGKWVNWTPTKNTISPAIQWAPATKYLADSNYLRLQFFTLIYLPSNFPSYKQEYQFDTTALFNSPEARSIVLDSAELFYNKGFIYAKQNFIRMRLVTADGPTGWSNYVEKKTLQEITFRNPASTKYPYPYSNPDVKQVFEAGPFEYQYCLDSNFLIPPIISAINERPAIEHNKTYYVRVRGMNPMDTSEWSKVQKYVTTNTTYVIHPRLISPADSSHGVLSNPVSFEWKPWEDDLADQYYFFLFMDTVKAENIVFYQEVTGTTNINISDLQKEKVYYWTVVATGTPRNESTRIYYRFNTYTTSNLNDVEEASQLFVYPNPVIDVLHLLSPNSIMDEFKCFNAFGESVLEGKRINHTTIHVDDLSPGMYIIQLRLADGTWVSQKFIKL